jgi:4,5-dihydroxyphthalate decarboxylase
MPNPRLRFRCRESTTDINSPITDGTVNVEGFELEMVTQGDTDAWDAGFGSLLRGKVDGVHHVSIPAFSNRKFRLSYIFVNNATRIESPRDLEGKRVGISSWGNTACMWAKGALQNHYGVDLTRIQWFAPYPDESLVAPGIQIQRLPKDGDTDALLLAGELNAIIEPNVLPSISRRDPRVRRLFRDYKAEEQNYFKQTGIFPISHIVTLSQEFVRQHPDAPVALLKAYRRARDVALDRIQGSDPQILLLSWASALLDEQRAVMGENYWAYNIENNRRALEAMTQFAYQQGVTPNRIDYESFFHPEAAALPGA